MPKIIPIDRECYACGAQNCRHWATNKPTHFTLCESCSNKIIKKKPCSLCGVLIKLHTSEKCRSCGARRKMSEETKQKLSIIKKGRPSKLRGRILSEETKKKISVSHMGIRHSPEILMNIGMKNSIKFQGEGNPFYGKKHTQQFKEEQRVRRLNRRFPKYDTKIELKIQTLLDQSQIKYVKHYNILNICQADQALPKLKIAIFEDGCYWHGCETHFPTYSIKTKERDIRNNKILIDDGWVVLRFWEHEIKHNWAKVKYQILQTINQRTPIDPMYCRGASAKIAKWCEGVDLEWLKIPKRYPYIINNKPSLIDLPK